MSGSDITHMIEGEVDRIVTEGILRSLNIQVQSFENIPLPAKSDPIAFNSKEETEDDAEEEEEDDLLTFVGASEDSFDEDDEEFSSDLAEETVEAPEEEEYELPDEFKKEIEDINMAVKDNAHRDSMYSDEIMADAQMMAEDDEYSGQDDVIAAAAASTGGRFPSNDGIGDDTPIDDGGGKGGLDVLPVDFGIKSVTRDTQGAVDFFVNALSGKEGNKRNRNGISRKVRQSLY